MNRRQFTASLAAAAAAPALPMGAPAVIAPQSASVPAGTYLWAQLIAQAQNRCSPAMLARQLRLSPTAATQVFNQLLQDQVIHAPGVTGIARAVKPYDTTGMAARSARPAMRQLKDVIPSEERRDDTPPLAKEPATCHTSGDPAPEEDENASTPEPVQESPQER